VYNRPLFTNIIASTEIQQTNNNIFDGVDNLADNFAQLLVQDRRANNPFLYDKDINIEGVLEEIHNDAVSASTMYDDPPSNLPFKVK
jgi:hypothetical protein